MGLRVQEEGKSKRRLVMRWIRVARQQHHPTRKRADFPLVFQHERVWATDSGDKADDSQDNTGWCSLP
jgi:hypothetical protein